METAVLAFSKQILLATYEMASVTKFVKKMEHQPAEKIGNILIDLYQQTVLLKIIWLLDWNFFYGKIEIFDFKKTPFRYVFSIAIMYSCETVWVKVLVSKGWLQSEITVQTL